LLAAHEADLLKELMSPGDGVGRQQNVVESKKRMLARGFRSEDIHSRPGYPF